MVKTRRRNYAKVSFNDEDDVREVSSTASEESGGSDTGGTFDDPPTIITDAAKMLAKEVEGFEESAPPAPPDAPDLPPPSPADSVDDDVVVDDADDTEDEVDPECKHLLPPAPPAISNMWKWFVELDESTTSAMALSATPESPLGSLRPFFKILELSCHGVPWLITVFSLIIFAKDSSMSNYIHLLLMLLVDLVVVGFSKAIFRRNRPKINIEDDVLTVSVDKFSFPSGHATRSTMLLFFLCHEFFPTDADLQTLVIFWATLVITSRIVIGRHYVFDVTCGCVIGGLVYAQMAPLLRPTAIHLAEVTRFMNQHHHLPDCISDYL